MVRLLQSRSAPCSHFRTIHLRAEWWRRLAVTRKITWYSETPPPPTYEERENAWRTCKTPNLKLYCDLENQSSWLRISWVSPTTLVPRSKNGWSYTSTHPSWRGAQLKHRDNFTSLPLLQSYSTLNRIRETRERQTRVKSLRMLLH